MSPPHSELTSDSLPQSSVQGRRSYILELIGAISVIGFFVGIYFAYQTQIAGVVTQREFDQLQTGQSLVEVNEILGFEGIPVNPDPDEASEHQPAASSETTYVWENSTISFARCTFVENRLTEKTAVDLP